MKITPPFANYELSYLERLVQQEFEQIEIDAVKILKNHRVWGPVTFSPMNSFDFQVLMAADKYVKQMKEEQ